LGEVREVHAWHGAFKFAPGNYFTKPETFPPSVDPVPSYLDWDLWLGPVPCSNPLTMPMHQNLGEGSTILEMVNWETGLVIQ